MISAVRVFFRDLRQWKVVGPLQVDPWQDLRIPHVLNQMRYPNPRDIRRSAWMKLVWASLNLTDSDCQYLSYWYPPDLIRAAAVLWTRWFALRRAEAP
jgi:hypothetical protein